MKTTRPLILVFVLGALFCAPTAQAASGAPHVIHPRVLATGLDHPKGLFFAPNGDLYVAESGHSNGTCPPPLNPAASVTSSGFSGEVVKITPDGQVTQVVGGLLSRCDNGEYSGPSAVAITPDALGQDILYVLQGGCAPVATQTCVDSMPLLKVRSNGNIVPVAQFASQGNGGTPNAPDENPFGLALGPNGRIYESDGANNSISAFVPSDTMQTVGKSLVQFPQDPTVTGLAVGHHGEVYAALFGRFPFLPGSGAIARVSTKGHAQLLLRGLIAPIGVVVSRSGTLYVLQYASAFVMSPFPHFLQGSGAVWRVNGNHTLGMVVANLNFPTAMAFGPNGKLYIVNNGTGPQPTADGQILSVDVGS